MHSPRSFDRAVIFAMSGDEFQIEDDAGPFSLGEPRLAQKGHDSRGISLARGRRRRRGRGCGSEAGRSLLPVGRGPRVDRYPIADFQRNLFLLTHLFFFFMQLSSSYRVIFLSLFMIKCHSQIAIFLCFFFFSSSFFSMVGLKT